MKKKTMKIGLLGVLYLMTVASPFVNAQVAADLSSVRVFPNPFQPAVGVSGVTFDNMPENVNIKIYKMTGQLIYDHDITTVDGATVWDVTNNDGKPVATGLYIYLITTGSGAKTKTSGKLVILK